MMNRPSIIRKNAKRVEVDIGKVGKTNNMGKKKKLLFIAKMLHAANADDSSWDRLLDTRDWSAPYQMAKDEYFRMARKIYPLIDQKELENLNASAK